MRELREETGYVGVVTETSPIMFNGALPLCPLAAFPCPSILTCKNKPIDPGFCNTNLRMIHLSIDPALPENQNPQPQLEENEFIEVFTAPLSTLWDECKKLELEGYAIDARVGTLAEGVEFAKRLKL